MPVISFRRFTPASIAFTALTCFVAGTWCSSTALAELQSLGSYYRADQGFPQYQQFWRGVPIEPSEADLDNQAEPGEKADRPATPARKPQPTTSSKPTPAEQPGLGGSLHVFVHNTSRQPVAVKDVLMAGISLNEGLAFSNQRKVKKFASIYFSTLTDAQKNLLIEHGEPVWWKADPPQIAAGGVGEIVVRLRQTPKPASVPVELRADRGGLSTAVARPARGQNPRVAGISFSTDLRSANLYFRYSAGAPATIHMDGKDITRKCTIHHDDAIAVTPVSATFERALEPSSYHVFAATYADGSVTMAGIRAWSDEFVYGTFGGKPGNENQPEIGRQYVDDLLDHNLNLQMPQIGSGAAQAFFRSAAGKSYMAARGFRFILQEVEKLGIRDPFALYVHDEPDCGDYKAEGLPENKKIGVLARWVLSRAEDMRKAAPSVMQMLNVNMTYQPLCWYTYGQIPDIFCVDPYYQVRLRDVYTKRPERKDLYKKATYISMVGDIAESSCEPRPLHMILYGNRYLDKKDKTNSFRYPTPAEKRIEVYYALSAGAKGLSYWWYTPAAPAYGLGGATHNPGDTQAVALWHEIGLMGAEVRTAGPIITMSCPIELKAEAPDSVMVRFLASGDHTLLMLAVNNNYENTDKGTTLEPVRNASVEVTLPGWMKSAQCFEISATGTKTLAARRSSAGLHIPLGSFDVTKMVAITSDGKLREQLQSYYADRLGDATGRLLKSGK